MEGAASSEGMADGVKRRTSGFGFAGSLKKSTMGRLAAAEGRLDSARLKQKWSWETRGFTEFEACSQRWGLLRWVVASLA